MFILRRLDLAIVIVGDAIKTCMHLVYACLSPRLGKRPLEFMDGTVDSIKYKQKIQVLFLIYFLLLKNTNANILENIFEKLASFSFIK